MGRAQGLFEKHNVNVEWVEIQDPPSGISAIASGDLDITVAPPPSLIAAVANDAKVVAVASGSNGTSDPPSLGFIARKDSGIQGVEDLRGKTVSVNNFGGNFELHLRAHLEESGLHPGKDVKIIAVPIPVAPQAVKSGQVDAAGVTKSGLLVAEADPELTMIFPLEAGPSYPSILVLAGTELVQDQRDAVVAFLDAYQDAVKVVQEDPTTAIELWAEDSGVADIAQIRSMDLFPTGAEVSIPDVERDRDLMVEYDILKSTVDVGSHVDNSLLEESAGDQ